MKKFKSKWFRVGVEGATSDKRTIERSWIEQAAKNFNREVYGARVWLEHFRGIFPDGDFRAYGDVIALKAEEVDINGQKKLALFAQIEPTDDLLAMNKKRQKIYTSMEIDPKFSDTDEAYLIGLAVTDSPASLGTEVLSFAQQSPNASPFSNRHIKPDAMFSEAIEAEIEFEEIQEQGNAFASLFKKVSDLLAGSKDKDAADETRFSDIHEATELLSSRVVEQGATIETLSAELSETKESLAATEQQLQQLSSDFNALSAQLDNEPEGQRPPTAGGESFARTDC